MASILVFYNTDDAEELRRFEQECLRNEGWFVSQQIGPAAFRLPSINANAIKIARLCRLLRKGTLRWVTVEDDEIKESHNE